MKKLSTTTLLLVVALSAADAQACGEVMYRMGGALRYHAFVTHHPAEILLYTEAARSAVSSDSANFHENLEKAGHKVTQVGTVDELAKALSSRHFDVIIAYAGDVATISDQIAHLAPEPALIPVFSHGSDELAVRQQYPLALNEDANLNQFLKTIEQTMKTRGT